MQIAQLSLVHRARGLGQQTLRALSLGEGDYVADGFRTSHHRHDAIQTECQSAVRRRAVLQRVQQEAELELRLFRADVERAEYLALHFFLVDTHRAAADLRTIQREVICLGQTTPRITFQQRKMFILGRGERMMACVPALGLLVVFEHRKVNHP